MNNKLEATKGVWQIFKWVLLLGVLLAGLSLLYNVVLAPLWFANNAINTAKGVTQLATDPATVKRRTNTACTLVVHAPACTSSSRQAQ